MPLLGRLDHRAAQSRIRRAWHRGSKDSGKVTFNYTNGDFRRSRDTVVTCGDLGRSALVSVRYLLTCP
jgi:hypothetical protein